MTRSFNSFDKPASNLIPVTVIGLSFAMGLYALLALPGQGNTGRSLIASLRDSLRTDYSMTMPAHRAGKVEIFKL